VFTFLIAFKDSCPRRSDNLKFLTSKLKSLNFSIVISEQSDCLLEEEGDVSIKNNEGLDRLLLKSNLPFSKSKLYNLGFKLVKTEYVWLLDADVLLDFKKIIKEVSGQFLIMPFSSVISLNKEETNAIFDKKELVLKNYKPRLDSAFGKYSILLKSILYEKCGGFNELFLGWGWQDMDFVYNRLGKYKPYKVEDCIGYHLWHPKASRNYERENYHLYKNNNCGVRKLSFCIVCNSLDEDFKKSLILNLKNNLPDSFLVDFNVLDLSPKNEVSDFIKSNFSEYINKFYLNLFKINNKSFINWATSMNTCHYLSEGAFISPLDSAKVLKHREGKNILDNLRLRGIDFLSKDSLFVCEKKLFKKVGGYIEDASCANPIADLTVSIEKEIFRPFKPYGLRSDLLFFNPIFGKFIEVCS
jgi:hypothetical protein